MINKKQTKEEELRKDLLNSFPDLDDFDNCLNKLKSFWTKESHKNAVDEIIELIKIEYKLNPQGLYYSLLKKIKFNEEKKE